MIRIGDFSKLAKTTIKTLRFYDDIGLFKPVFVDDNGYRYYGIEQLNVLQKIVVLRSLEMPIDEIKKILNGYDSKLIFENRLSELEEELSRNQRNISLVKKFMERIQKGDFMNSYKAIEKVLPACIVYYSKGIIEDYSKLTEFVLNVGSEVRENNPTLKCANPEYCFVCYGSKEYKEKDVEVEYFEAVQNFGKESDNVKFKKIEAQKAICVEHKGAYCKLNEAYAFAVNWVKQNAYEICGDIRERYVDGCWNKKNEDEYLTEIQIPIK